MPPHQTHDNPHHDDPEGDNHGEDEWFHGKQHELMLRYMEHRTRNRRLSMLVGMVCGFLLLVAVALLASELTR